MRRSLRVFVYRNLNNGLFSVRDKRTGRVIAHAKGVQLEDAVFRVGDKGCQRVLSSRRKNVHAGVEGTLVIDPSRMSDLPAVTRRVSYDPYHSAYFIDGSGCPVTRARVAWVRDGAVWVP